MGDISSRVPESFSAISLQAGSTGSVHLSDAEATREFGVWLGRSLPSGSTLLLDGDLGSGKTTLVQGIGAGLGISGPIVSPTFMLINEYLDGRFPLYHLDLYRLEPAEVTALNLQMYWDDQETPPGIVAIEWPERLPYRPTSYLRFFLALAPDGGRLVQWDVI